MRETFSNTFFYKETKLVAQTIDFILSSHRHSMINKSFTKQLLIWVLLS